MEIYVIRHTTPDVAKGVCYGHSNIPVTLAFEEEVRPILLKIPQHIQIIYTSPLQRCARLATAIAAQNNVHVIADDRLKELNFGDWEMQRWDAIEQTALMRWMDNYEEECCPNGESYLQLVSRVKNFLEAIGTSDHQTIAVVTHGGVIKSMKAIIDKISLKDAMAYQSAYGEIIRFQL